MQQADTSSFMTLQEMCITLILRDLWFGKKCLLQVNVYDMLSFLDAILEEIWGFEVCFGL